jgi:hypothetical protein
MESSNLYLVSKEAAKLLINRIISNPLIRNLLANASDLYKYIKYKGNNLLSIPVNWRLIESIAALKGFEAIILNYLLSKKYKTVLVDIIIDT